MRRDLCVVTPMSCAKTVEPIKIPFGKEKTCVGRINLY